MKLRHSLLLLALFGGTLSMGLGCKSLESSVLSERPNWYSRPSWAIEVVKRRQLTSVNQTIGEDYEKGKAAIDPKKGRIFIGTSDRGFYALRANDLSTLWRFQTLGVVQSEPLYDKTEDVVYFGCNDGALYKVKAEDGTLLWRFNTNAEILRAPVLNDGILYFANANDTIIAIDSTTGKLKWSNHRQPPQGLEIAGHSGVTIKKNKVFIAFSDGHLVAFDANTGEEKWSSDLIADTEESTGELPTYLDVDTTPVAIDTSSGPIVVVASYGGGVFAFDTEYGSHVWRNNKSLGVTELVLWEEATHPRFESGHSDEGKSPPIPRKRMLIASSGTTGLWALDLEDGHPFWRRSLPEGGVSAAVAVAGAIMVSTTRYGLFLFSPTNGAAIDGIDTGSGFAVTPVAFGRRAFVMSNQGVLLGLMVHGPSRNAKDKFKLGEMTMRQNKP
jgi:outer membrane protein assembly factor BamB